MIVINKVINSKICFNLCKYRFYHKSFITSINHEIQDNNDISIKKEILSINKVANEPIKSFHKRPLPTSLISLSSIQGKQLFTEALLQGGLNSYFPLAEQFVTQSEPSFCSLSSLSMVLNALNFDPKKVWKGAWRWINEEMLLCESTQICGHSLERIKAHGMNFKEFETLARCHGVRISSFQASMQDTAQMDSPQQCIHSFERFQHYIETISKDSSGKSFMVINFSRKVLDQTGDGHFSPIAGYHPQKGLVLVLDVARFKYPPYWVPIETIWQAMNAMDLNTNQARGYFIISGWDDMNEFNIIQHDDVSNSFNDNNVHHHHHDQHHPQKIPLTATISTNTTNNTVNINKNKGSPNHLHDTSTVCNDLIERNNTNNNTVLNSNTLQPNVVVHRSDITIQDTGVQPSTLIGVCPPRIRTWQDVKKTIPNNNQCCIIKNGSKPTS